MLLLLCMVFTACQPTPEKENIINKGDGKLEERIVSPAISPSHSEKQNVGNSMEWKEEYKIGENVLCKFDVEFFLPNNDGIFPVFSIKKTSFKPETIDDIAKFFITDAEGFRISYPTKQELEKQLINVKRGTYILDDNGGRWETYDRQQEDIIELEKRIAAAKQEVFESVERIKALPVQNTYLMPNNTRAYIYASEKNFSYCKYNYAVMQMQSWIIDGEAYPGEKPNTIIETALNINKAEKEAKELLSKLNIFNFGIAHTEKARFIENYTYQLLSTGWAITFTRDDGNSVPLDIGNSQTGGILNFSNEYYSERWCQEKITVYVDEEGVKYFSWSNPIEIQEKLNENVQLLSFDEIKLYAKQALKYGLSNSYAINQNTEMQIFTINRAVLTNVMVPIKDNQESRMLIPAWIFIFNASGLENMTFSFCINAVDGSNIDLQI